MTYRRSFLTAFAFLALLFVAHAQESSGTVEEFTVNGLKVIVKNNPANDILSVQMYIQGGSADLTGATQGIAPLLYGAAAKATAHYPKEALNKILDRTGASMANAATRDYNVVSMRCLKRDLPLLWDVFTDVLLQPALDSTDVALVRATMLSTIRQRNDGPDGQLQELTDSIFFAGTPYALDPNGTESSVGNLSIDQLRTYRAAQMQTSKMLLVIVGNVSKADVQKNVERAFSALPKGSFTQSVPPAIRHLVPTVSIVEKKIPTNYIQGTFTAPGLTDPDFPAMQVAMNVLGWRVFEEVRTKRNLSYAPGAGFDNLHANRGWIYVTAVQPDTTIKVMLGEMKKLQTEPVSEKILRDRIALFLTGYSLRNETNASQGMFLATYEMSGLGWKAGDRFIETLKKVTAQDVMRVAKTYFRNLQFGVIGDPTLITKEVFTSF